MNIIRKYKEHCNLGKCSNCAHRARLVNADGSERFFCGNVVSERELYKIISSMDSDKLETIEVFENGYCPAFVNY